MATLIKYNGKALGWYTEQEITIHCTGTIMRGNLEIILDAQPAEGKLGTPAIYLEQAPDTGDTAAILGRAILGRAILGRSSVLPQLDTPVIKLVDSSLQKLTTPTIYIKEEGGIVKLDAPEIYLETEAEELPKLDTPSIYLWGAKIETPVIELKEE